MGNDLQLDISSSDHITNPMRRHAALTICEYVRDVEDAASVLLMVGLVRMAGAGFAEDGHDAGVTWSRHERTPAPSRVRAAR